MRTKLAGILLVCLLAGVARAEQLRLRTGDFLQGEVVPDRSDDENVAVRLYSTGGEFLVRWDQLIPEDEKRLRDNLGLSPWDEAEVPTVPGYMVILKKEGEVILGVVENVTDRSKPLRIRTVIGTREITWDQIADVKETRVDALTIYEPSELAKMALEEMRPATSADYFQLALREMQFQAYREALEHLKKSLEDQEFAGTEQGQSARNLLARVEILVRAGDGLKRVRDVKNLRFQKRFDQSLEEIKKLREEYEQNPAILKLLDLDRLEKQIASDRRNYFVTEVRRRFFTMMEELVAAKARERDSEDKSKDISAKVAAQWAVNPRGLAQEIFAAICEQTGVKEAEAKELWEARGRGMVRRYNYGGATFSNPDRKSVV